MTKYDHLLLAVVKLFGCIALVSGGIGMIRRWWRDGFAMEDAMFVALVCGIYVIFEHVRCK